MSNSQTFIRAGHLYIIEDNVLGEILIKFCTNLNTFFGKCHTQFVNPCPAIERISIVKCLTCIFFRRIRQEE